MFLTEKARYFWNGFDARTFSNSIAISLLLVLQIYFWRYSLYFNYAKNQSGQIMGNFVFPEKRIMF